MGTKKMTRKTWQKNIRAPVNSEIKPNSNWGYHIRPGQDGTASVADRTSGLLSYHQRKNKKKTAAFYYNQSRTGKKMPGVKSNF